MGGVGVIVAHFRVKMELCHIHAFLDIRVFDILINNYTYCYP